MPAPTPPKPSKPPQQSDTTLEDINQLIWRHLEARDWHQPAARSVAISLSLEANELLEHYQWRDKAIGSKEDLAAELADIIIYAFQFAQVQGIDIADAVRAKIAKSAQKYPAADYKGKGSGEMHTAWVKAKIKSRRIKKGL